MDHETLNLLHTVCVAGGARAAFNDDANARLDLLVEAGLLAIADPLTPETQPAARRHRFYRPTKKGVTMLAAIQAHGAA